jgi:selenocysteine-specific elongation factor
MHVIATAGHVDHGKSSLVLALTGTDPDRLEEEKRRGLTIDLGFAHCVLPSGAGVSFVDVPGHVKFLKNMLAGIGAVDAVLFVVAATEGWKPQSEEHLRILQLAGVSTGVIVLTKTDLVSADDLELARLFLADHVAGTFLEHAPVICTALGTAKTGSSSGSGVSVGPVAGSGLGVAVGSGVGVGSGAGAGAGVGVGVGVGSGADDVVDSATAVGSIRGDLRGGSDAVGSSRSTGIAELRAELDALVARTPSAVDRGRARLWVDRVFAAKGSGTVVTGTLAGGFLATGDHIVVGPRGVTARIRGIQSLGQPHDRIGPGNRVALNLSGIEHTEIERGDAVIHPHRWHSTQVFDASLHVLEALGHSVNRRGAFAVYLGSGEYPARLRVLGAERLEPGTSGAVRLRLSSPLPLLPGDRLIVRESGRSETVGGGEVLDVSPILPASRAKPDRNPDRVVSERGWILSDELERLTGETRPTTIGRWVGAPGRLEALVEQVRTKVTKAGDLGLDVASLDEREREIVATTAGLEVNVGRVRFAEVRDPLADHSFVAALATGGFAPPGADGVDRTELRLLIQRGLIIESEGVWFHPDAIAQAGIVAARLLAEYSSGFTVAQFRDAVGATRKYVLPLVAELDRRGVTRRRDDFRIAGPRLPVI